MSTLGTTRFICTSSSCQTLVQFHPIHHKPTSGKKVSDLLAWECVVNIIKLAMREAAAGSAPKERQRRMSVPGPVDSGLDVVSRWRADFGTPSAEHDGILTFLFSFHVPPKVRRLAIHLILGLPRVSRF